MNYGRATGKGQKAKGKSLEVFLFKETRKSFAFFLLPFAF